jgi:hypothetical protein
VVGNQLLNVKPVSRTITTDAAGQLSLDLPGLGTDTVYVLRTAMKHGNRTYIKQPGNCFQTAAQSSLMVPMCMSAAPTPIKAAWPTLRYPI